MTYRALHDIVVSIMMWQITNHYMSCCILQARMKSRRRAIFAGIQSCDVFLCCESRQKLRKWSNESVILSYFESIKNRSRQTSSRIAFGLIRPCQHDDGYRPVDGRSRFKSTPTNGHSAWSARPVTYHPSTNQGRRCLTSVNVLLS